MMRLLRRTNFPPAYNLRGYKPRRQPCLLRSQTEGFSSLCCSLPGLRPKPTAYQPAVDHEGMAIDKGRLVAGEPERGLGNILGKSGSLDRLSRFKQTLHDRDRLIRTIRCNAKCLAENRCRDTARTDAVDSDTALAEFHRNGASKVNDRGLRCAVNVAR